jgi:hypothetical protein
MSSPGSTRRWLVLTPASTVEAILDEFRAEWHTEAIHCHLQGKLRGIYPIDSILLEACDDLIDEPVSCEPDERTDEPADNFDPPVADYLAAVTRRKSPSTSARNRLVRR